MSKYEKVYVTTYLRVDRDGYFKPIEIEWGDGRKFAITGILDKRQAPPRHVGGSATVRYTVLISGKEKELFHQTFDNKWFVEKRIL